MASIGITLFIVIMVNVHPFKDDAVSTKSTIFVSLLALWHVGTVGSVQEDIISPDALHYAFEFVLLVVALIPLVYASVIVAHWLYQHKNFGTDLIRKLRAWQHGYQLLSS